jgi:hypothetical protein
MPPLGDYTLANIGFSRDEKPVLLLQSGEEFIEFSPTSHTFSVAFDMSVRYCTGWRDITKGELHTCPEHNLVDVKYEQCRDCQARTGFNPAFYHATSVSEQQEARNQEPHILYLAHFGPSTVKVGISHAARGRSRLLEQGARSAIILDTLSSAHVARHYEERIAKLPGISETIQLNKKLVSLKQPYDHEQAARELETYRQTIEEQLHVNFVSSDVLYFDAVYLPNTQVNPYDIVDVSQTHHISGTAIGMIGSILLTTHSDAPLIFALKKHVGYRLTLDTMKFVFDLPAQQTSLF